MTSTQAFAYRPLSSATEPAVCIVIATSREEAAEKLNCALADLSATQDPLMDFDWGDASKENAIVSRDSRLEPDLQPAMVESIHQQIGLWHILSFLCD